MENSSRRYSYAEVKKMVERQKEKYGWEFLFLGANIDAVKEAGRFGISEDHAVNYECDSMGTEVNYRVLGKAISKVRKASGCKASLDHSWKEEIEQDYRNRHQK
ncbi:MAG: hypothetical protein J6K75_00595, partial [Erysipelotrichaceae bacterium]|nr:hypothetical protein [Erysipelotrichaceae bacterium]